MLLCPHPFIVRHTSRLDFVFSTYPSMDIRRCSAARFPISAFCSGVNLAYVPLVGVCCSCRTRLTFLLADRIEVDSTAFVSLKALPEEQAALDR